MNAGPRRSIRLSLAVLGLALILPTLAACSVASGESVGSAGEAITSCGGTELGVSQCAATAPKGGCYGNPSMTLLAGVDPTDARDRAPLLTWAGSCSYRTPGGVNDDVKSFMSAMSAYTDTGAVPIGPDYNDPAGVFLGYDVSTLSASALAGVEALVNQYACNSVVAPGLFRQTPSFGDCAYSKTRPYLPTVLVIFDPRGCGGAACV